MSTALVPPAEASSFPQAGRGDWVALSSTAVQFTAAVLVTLSKAGTNVIAPQIGKATCSNFALTASSQEKISKAIQDLKQPSSRGDLIWLGFDIKPVILDLAETEEGLTLVALCAVLSATYDSTFAARVFRQLCILCKAPESFTPTIQQWKILVEECAGKYFPGQRLSSNVFYVVRPSR